MGEIMAETATKPILTCSQCMGAFFYQIERRLTGVVIDEGKVIVQEPRETKTTVFYTCQRCGCIVPPDKVKDFEVKLQTPEPSKN